MEMRKCRLGVVIYFSRGVSTLVHRKYTEKNALLKLCDIGKVESKSFFYFGLVLIFGHGKVFLKMGVPKK